MTVTNRLRVGGPAAIDELIMDTTPQPVIDPFTGERPVGMRRLYGSMPVDDKIKYCERLLNEGHEQSIESAKDRLKTMDKGDWRHDNMARLRHRDVPRGAVEASRAVTTHHVP